MAHLVWTKQPVTSPPTGLTIAVQASGQVVVTGDLKRAEAWQLELMRAGELTHENLLGASEADPEEEVVTVSRSSLDALSKAKTLSDFRAASGAVVAGSKPLPPTRS